MTLTTAQAFDKFLADLAATDYQKSTLIPARRQTVDDRLGEKFAAASDMPYWKSILIGSAAKNTIIRPFDDIDVLAVFSNEKDAWSKYARDSKSFIYRIRDAYDGLSIHQVGTRGQAVRVFFQTGGHVDIAPVFFVGDSEYMLPAGDGSWISTAPTIANEWYGAKNGALAHHLTPLVRLLKSWNRCHSKRMKSFHLETVAGHVFSSLGSNYRDALHKFFLWAPGHLVVSDPGGHSTDLSSYLTPAGRQQLLDSLASAAARASDALEAEGRGDHAKAKRLWRIILGDEFPTG